MFLNLLINYTLKINLGKFNMTDACILFKDHKPNFKNKLQFSLINPSKPDLGIISKDIIQNIVLNIQKKKNYP